MTITTRSGKGSTLTHPEMDANLNTFNNWTSGPATKTEAKALTPEDGVKIYPQGSEGPFIGGTGQVAGFYDDDSATNSYGTKFKPTGGDGSTGYKRPDTEPLNVFHFMLPAQIASVLKWDGVEDVTTPWKEAIAAGKAQARPTVFPSGRHVITDTLLLENATQLFGEHKNMGFVAPSVAFRSGTYIDFQPTSLKSLFEPTGLPAILKDGYAIDGFFIQGNSTDASGNSNIGINVDQIIKSTFRNLRIQGFRTPIRCSGTIGNNFDFVHPTGGYIQDILYEGQISTTDIWSKCYISNSPIGINTNGPSKNIQFNNCKIEAIDTYGVNLVKETQSMTFTNCYGESVPELNVGGEAMFRVGYDGTTLSTIPQLIINGGDFGGSNVSNRGSWLDIDFTDGVMIRGAPHFGRFVNGIKTSANTQTNQIVSTGFTCLSTTNVVTDTTKIKGMYPENVLNGVTRANQNAAFRQVAFDNSPSTPLNDYRELTGTSAACTGAITTASEYEVTKMGREVTLTLPPVEGTASASAFFAFGTLLTAAYFPASIVEFPCVIKDNGALQNQPGKVSIQLNGQIRVYKDLVGTGNYTAAAVSGLGNSAAVSWTV